MGHLDHFRCSRRMTGAVERELLSSALVLYELRVPGTFHGSTVVAYDIVTIVFHHATLKYSDCGSNFGRTQTTDGLVILRIGHHPFVCPNFDPHPEALTQHIFVGISSTARLVGYTPGSIYGLCHVHHYMLCDILYTHISC